MYIRKWPCVFNSRLALALTFSLLAHLLLLGNWSFKYFEAPAREGRLLLKARLLLNVLDAIEPAFHSTSLPVSSLKSRKRELGPSDFPSVSHVPETQVESDPVQYFSAENLDARPKITEPVAIPRPAVEVAGGAAKVVLQLYVNRWGGVDKVEVLWSDATTEVQAMAADAFKQVKFYPGVLGGEPVNSTIQVEVEFAD